MKIKVEFTIEIDQKAWENEYRNGDKAADIRDSIRETARAAVVSELGSLGINSCVVKG